MPKSAAAVFVGEDVGECSADETFHCQISVVLVSNERARLERRGSCVPGSVEDGDKVECHGYGHPVVNGGSDDIVQWNEHSPYLTFSFVLSGEYISPTVQEKAANTHEKEVEFSQWSNILAQFERSWFMLKIRRDC
jgi:hypothetical protein